MRKWLREHLPKHEEIKQNSNLSWLGSTIHHPNLWRLNRRSVSNGVAVGLFAAFIPLPVQMLVAAVLALVFKANLPIAVVCTWVTNPITFIPINFFVYKVGRLILGDGEYSGQAVPLSFDWDDSGSWVEICRLWVDSLGRPFLVGLPVVAIGAAILGWLAVYIAWRIGVKVQWRNRRNLTK